jgi:choice-of-anchor A domain-containing protein
MAVGVARRLTAAGASACVAATGWLVAGVLFATPAAAQQASTCPDVGGGPAIGEIPAFTDGNVAIFAGGSFTATGQAAEAEGLMVVMGTATFDRPTGGTFNVGTVGAGSQIAPPPGTDMLVTGGGVVVGPNNTLSVGALSVGQDGTLLGGNINTAGSVVVQPGGSVETSNGSIVENNPQASAPFAGFGASLTSASGQFSALPDTGSTAVSFGTATFTGNGTSNPQVFTISAAQLATAQAFVFNGIPTNPTGGWVPIIVNVTGAGPATMLQNFMSINGTRVDDLGVNMGNAARSLLWNFTSASDVTIAGTSQNIGSLLVPQAGGTLTVNASTNGRVYTNGNIVMSGSGNEMHNYPWNGDARFDCGPGPLEAPTGSALIAKSLTPGSPLDTMTDASGELPRFHGTVTCQESDGATFVEDFTVRPPNSFEMEGLPLNVPCTISEDLTLTDQNGVPIDIGDFRWATPVITVNGTVTNTFTVTEASPAITVEIALANTLLGSFEVTKEVSGPDSGFVDTSRTFDVHYDCNTDGYTINPATGLGVPVAGSASGTITVADGQTLPPTSGGSRLYFPTGTDCVISEATPTGNDFANPSFHWFTPSFSPVTITIGGNSLADAIKIVTVTNEYVQTTGGFTISKAVAGDPGADVSRFTGAWTCDASNTAGATTGTWDLAGGETLALDGFPVGTSCTVTENNPNPDENAGTWTTTINPSGPFTITEGDATNLTVTVTNTFTRALGGFRIAKEVLNGAGSTVTTFTIDWSCDAPNTAGMSSGSVTLAGAATSAPITGFPTGTVCTISEPTITDPAGNWTSSVSGGGQITITPGNGTAAGDLVTVVNVFNEVLGGFTLSKVVHNGAGATVTQFTGTWTCSAPNAASNTTGTWTLAAGATLTVDGFPPGTTCTITEDPITDPAGTWTTSITPASITVTNNAGVGSVTPVEVGNTFTATFGGFTIRKQVLAAAGASVTHFPIHWSCSAPSTTEGASGTVTLANGGSATLTGFPTGTVCTLDEPQVSDANGTWHFSIAPPQVTITEGNGTAPADLVTVDNTFERTVGGFILTKAVNGDPGATVTAFTGTWSCTHPNTSGQSSGTWTLSDGASQTFDGFPADTVCTITEPHTTDPDGTWTTTLAPSNQITIRPGDPSAGATLITNTFRAIRGGFSIHKSVQNGAGAEISQFAVTFTCTQPSNEVGESGTITVTNGLTVTLPGFPIGTRCTMTEAPIHDRNGTWTTSISPIHITIGTGDPSATAATITATNTFTKAPTTTLPTTGLPVAEYVRTAIACIALGAGLVLTSTRRRDAKPRPPSWRPDSA